jgi:hypothetical protein
MTIRPRVGKADRHSTKETGLWSRRLSQRRTGSPRCSAGSAGSGATSSSSRTPLRVARAGGGPVAPASARACTRSGARLRPRSRGSQAPYAVVCYGYETAMAASLTDVVPHTHAGTETVSLGGRRRRLARWQPGQRRVRALSRPLSGFRRKEIVDPSDCAITDEGSNRRHLLGGLEWERRKGDRRKRWQLKVRTEVLVCLIAPSTRPNHLEARRQLVQPLAMNFREATGSSSCGKKSYSVKPSGQAGYGLRTPSTSIKSNGWCSAVTGARIGGTCLRERAGMSPRRRLGFSE